MLKKNIIRMLGLRAGGGSMGREEEEEWEEEEEEEQETMNTYQVRLLFCCGVLKPPKNTRVQTSRRSTLKRFRMDPLFPQQWSQRTY